MGASQEPERNVLLVRARFNAGLTQTALARKAKVHVRTIQNLERGAHPEAPTAKRVADVFGLQATDLFPLDLLASERKDSAA
jgi:DNA-binding XRE family transcriptional regulator